MMSESYVCIYFFSSQVNQSVTLYLPRVSSDVSHSFSWVNWSTFLYEKLSDTKFWRVEDYFFSAYSRKRNACIKSLDIQRQRT